MRNPELVILILTLVSFMITLLPLKKRNLDGMIFTGLGLSFSIIYILAHGFYWQMAPAYILLLALAAKFSIDLLKKDAANKKGWVTRILRWTCRCLFVIIFLAATLLPVLFPMFDVPKPTGPYQVGITEFDLKDTTRPEILTDDPDDFREFMVTVWYPAKILKNAKPAPYMKNAGKIFGTGMSQFLGRPELKGLFSFIFSYLEKIPSNSYWDAKLAPKKENYPVLVFNHGLYSYTQQNTPQMEMLASNGYVVFSVSHPYDAFTVQYPDNRTVIMKNFRTNTNDGVSNAKNDDIIYTKLLHEQDYQQFEKYLLEYCLGYPKMIELTKYWSADIGSLLDRLENIPDQQILKRFENRLNLDQIGVFGHSAGGATASEFCLTDKRCKAGLNMDGLSFTDNLESVLQVPFMFMDSDYSYAYRMYGVNNNRYSYNDFLYNRSKNVSYLLTLKKSTHFNFTDLTFMFPEFKRLGVIGDIPKDEMNDIMNTYILAFFNKHLLNKYEPLLDGSSDKFPDAELKIRDGR